jgi:phosphoribosylformylglycinamidine synthase PurS subunit
MARLKITVTLKRTVEDSEGLSVLKALQLLGYDDVESVRTGKVYYITTRGTRPREGEEFCQKLLSNPVINECEVKNEK